MFSWMKIWKKIAQMFWKLKFFTEIGWSNWIKSIALPLPIENQTLWKNIFSKDIKYIKCNLSNVVTEYWKQKKTQNSELGLNKLHWPATSNWETNSVKKYIFKDIKYIMWSEQRSYKVLKTKQNTKLWTGIE